ncbi:MAG TPA: TMEM14 family protein [Chthoniobacterales bacterium]|nr:TMEM14 family protein [Chthoniobacterales bacterium]
MIGPAKIYFIVFGLLTIVGGVIGYVKAGSMASIIAGSILGILLLVAAYLLPGNLALGLALAALVSIALAGRFVPIFIKSGQVMPAGLMSLLSVIGVIMAIVAWIRK